MSAIAAGTLIVGPLGDRIGRKNVIWGSILGSAPCRLVLPYVLLYWTGLLTVIIGVILASAFSAVVVYAQKHIPGKVGLVSGLFFGFAFGMGGLGAAILGYVADLTSIELDYQICALLSLIALSPPCCLIWAIKGYNPADNPGEIHYSSGLSTR